MPVKAMAMPYLSQHLDDHCRPGWSRRARPHSCTPLLWARSMLSAKGKKASEPRATPVRVPRQACFLLLGQGRRLAGEVLLPDALGAARPSSLSLM